MRILVAASIFLIISHSLKSQNASILNDYYIDLDGNSKKIRLSEIFSFELDNRKYIKVPVYHSSLFARAFIQGDVSVYQSLVDLPKGEAVRIYIHRKGDEYCSMLKRKSLAAYFSKKYHLSQKIDSRYYNISDIESMLAIDNQKSKITNLQ